MSYYTELIGNDCFLLILQFCRIKNQNKIINSNHKIKNISKSPQTYKYYPLVTIKNDNNHISNILPYIPKLKMEEWTKHHLITGNNSLEYLDLAYNYVSSPDNGNGVLHLISNSSKLKSLSLRGMGIYESYIPKCINCISSPSKLLQLDLSFIYGWVGTNPPILGKISDAISKLDQLEELDFNGNKFGESTIENQKMFFDQVRHLKKLKILRLSSNGLNKNSMDEFVPYFSDFNHLETLTLSYNKIDRDGAILLGQNIDKLTQLQALYLEHNQIELEGTQVMYNHLMKLTHLSELRLYRNSINVEGETLLGKLTLKFPKLKLSIGIWDYRLPM
jgi:Ran GTPase-activating protein (RanGAP) involved in mRNA processing and transport